MRAIYLILAFLALAACEGKSTDEYLANAKDYLDVADYSAASIELRNALQQDTDSAEARWLLGNVLLDTGEILSAEEQLLRARDLGWHADDVRPALAKVLLGQGKVEDVLALEHQNLSSEAAARLLSTQAMAALADQQTDKAHEMVDLAVDKAPHLPAVKLAKATLFVREGDMTTALELVREIEEEAPGNSGAQWLKGQILLLQGDLEAARVAIDHSIANSADTALIDHIMRALVSVQLKDYDAALEDAAVVLEHNAKDPTANYIVGVNLFHNGEYRNAIETLRLARPVSQQFPLVLYYLSSSYLIERELDLAESFASEFHKLVPNNSNGRKLLAAILLNKDRADQALEILQPVLDQNPGDVQALNFKANALLLEGKADLGMLLYAQISRLQPDWQIVPLPLEGEVGRSDKSEEASQRSSSRNDIFPQSNILSILNHLARKDFEGAIEAAQSYHLRDTANIGALNVLGRTYFAAGRSAEAREVFENALKRELANPSANWSLAEMALATGDASAARANYEAVLYGYSRDLTTLVKLAELEARLGNTRAMTTWLSKAIQGNPMALEPRLRLAEYYMGSGSPKKIEPLFAEISALQRRSLRVLELTALAQLSRKQNDSAVATLQQWIEEDPSAAQAYYLLALAANAAGDLQKSKQTLLEAVEHDPRHALSLLSLAKLARFEGDEKRFEQYLATLVDVAPDAPQVLRLRALAAQGGGNDAEALELSRQAFEQAPTTQGALELVSLQKVAGENQAAEKTLEQWVKKHPDDIDARLFLANYWMQQNDAARARLQYVAVLDRDADNVTALNNLAWTLRQENPEKALEYIRKAAKSAPDQPELLDTLAVIEFLNGENISAQNNIRRALAGRPDNLTMRYHDAMITAALGDKDEAIAALQKLLNGNVLEFPERAEAEALLKKLSG